MTNSERFPVSNESFLDEVMSILAEQIRENLPSMREVILKSGRDALQKSGQDIARWNAMLAAGSISSKEYEWLVDARISIIEMDTLRAAGLALVQIDEFRASLVQSITGVALRVVGV